jgi:(p)ppGpp synthase/HD superfamily hydrolase
VSLGERFRDALGFAFDLHARQQRKGSGVPYVAHLLGVCSIVLDHGGTEDEAIAALLHDAVEDQGGAAVRHQIRDRFGDAVAAIVDGCSDADVEPKPPWRPRKEAYLAHLPGAPPSVRLVSAADKLHNARTILADLRAVGEQLWDRFRGGKDGTLWYYRSLVDLFRQTGPADLAEDLAQVVEEIERAAAECRLD